MSVRILLGDVRERLKELPDESVHCCVTSPPYFGLRDYGVDGQIGLEPTPDAFVAELAAVFDEVRRVLRKDGTLWLNLGDSYAGSWGNYGGSNRSAGKQRAIVSGSRVPNEAWDERTKFLPPAARGFASLGIKPKDIIGVPWMAAFALRSRGWFWRDAVVWAKPNAMPGSQQDRCTSSYEPVLFFSKEARYFSDFDAIKTPPRESTLIRTAQDIQAQAGSHRANGGAKTNGPMKAVGGLAKPRRSDKQRGHSRQHAGFNDRWDARERTEQQARPAMMRNVWFVSPASYKEAHFAVMPEEVARRCVLAGSPEGGTVLDPFFGAGTTGVVCQKLNRNCIGIELNPKYVNIAEKRLGIAEDIFS